MAVFLPQKVHAGVGGQPVKPCGKGGISPEKGQALPCGEECLLRRLLREFRREAHPHRKGEHPLLVLLHQLSEGRLIAVPGRLYQVVFLIVHGPS